MDKDIKNILVCRTDRIGDLILSLPVATALKKHIPGIKVTFLINKYTEAVIKGCPDIDNVIYFDSDENKDILTLVKDIRKYKFDAAVVLFPVFKVAMASYLAGIPVRIGSGYRSYSFLFNKKVYEHRKYSEKHEVEFNLRLIEELGIECSSPEFNFILKEADVKAAEEVLQENRISADKKLVIIHPGSGGSALEWPVKNFGTFARNLSENLDVEILLTWGENELEKVQSVNETSGNVCKILDRMLTLEHFIALISKSELVVTNSTGPIHIAAMLGREVIGFYPPILACSYKRWGPYGREDSVFVPDIPPCKKCISEKCKYFDCMDRITPEMAVKKAVKVIKNEK